MKKNWKIATLACSLMMAGMALASCGGGGQNREPGSLAIMFYNGGYGDEWVQTIVDDYMAYSGNSVVATPDKTISAKAESNLTSKQGSEYDIFISHDLNWQNFADRGLIANLDDLYENGETVDGEKFSDRVLPEAKKIAKYKGSKDDAEHYYQVCLTQGAGGFVYNATMFEENNWTVPTTYDELKALCATIANTSRKDDPSKKYIPFTWAAGSAENRDYYWDYPIYEWWAELSGLDAIEKWKSFQGANGYEDGYKNFDPNGDFAGFKQAYKMWYDLVAMNPTYSNEDPQGTPLTTAQNLFFTGQAAMIPYGQWAKHEIEQAAKSKFSFEVRMMKTPRAKATSDYYNFMVGFGDSIIVAKDSPNLEVAKDFIAYLASKQSCKTFVEKADGPFLAFDYSTIDMTEARQASSYVDSMYKILTECKNFSIASNSPIALANGTIVIQPWIENQRYYGEAIARPEENTPDIVMGKIYQTASESWSTYCRAAEV